ncbi:LOW QUALITY PROTEIN: hypothetical protein YC2023_093875 [Brassica napus]
MTGGGGSDASPSFPAIRSDPDLLRLKSCDRFRRLLKLLYRPTPRWYSREAIYTYSTPEEDEKRRLRKEAREWSDQGWRPELESFRSPEARAG